MTKAFLKNLIQFISSMALSWLILYFVAPIAFYEHYLPFSFFLLFWIIALTVVVRGWPFVPAEGIWKPGKSKVSAAVLMTVLTVGLALISTLFVTDILPGLPLFPVAFYFGAFVFITMVWYAFIWQSYPIAKKSPGRRVVMAVVVTITIAAVLWKIFVNLNGTPFAGKPFDPQGFFSADYMVGQMVWILVWVMLFGCTMEGYPFDKLPKPLDRIIQTAVIVALGILCWNVTIEFMNPSFSFAGIGGSIIAWSLFQSAIFGFYPNPEHKQPKKCILNLIVVIGMAVIWTLLLQALMSPIYENAKSAGIPFDISAIGMFFSLHVVAVLLLMHNSFWFKAPFASANAADNASDFIEGENL